MLIALESISQTSKIIDTICLPVSQLKIAINQIEIGKVNLEELISTKKIVLYQDSIIKKKDSLISLLHKTITKNVNIISNMKRVDSLKQKIIYNQNVDIYIYKSKLRKSKFAKYLIATLFTLFIIIKK